LDQTCSNLFKFVLAHLTTDTVTTTLEYKAKTVQQQLPYGLPLDNTKLCELVSKEGPEKPTHVVSEVTYGLNAYMQFTKKYRFVII
jgi:hypothetical protein